MFLNSLPSLGGKGWRGGGTKSFTPYPILPVKGEWNKKLKQRGCMSKLSSPQTDPNVRVRSL
jgi:hypothetical protein